MLQRQGKEKEAQNLYNSVLKQRPEDIGLVAVASNNLLTINRSLIPKISQEPGDKLQMEYRRDVCISFDFI